MPNEVDALTDKALAASKIAQVTHQDQHHKDAADAHSAAFGAAQAGERPALAQHHLQQAALHARHADPTEPEGKGEAAHRATAKARASGDAKDHDAAAQAHEDAHQAFSDAGNGKRAGQHMMASGDHTMAAQRLRAPPQARPPTY